MQTVAIVKQSEMISYIFCQIYGITLPNVYHDAFLIFFYEGIEYRPSGSGLKKNMKR